MFSSSNKPQTGQPEMEIATEQLAPPAPSAASQTNRSRTKERQAAAPAAAKAPRADAPDFPTTRLLERKQAPAPVEHDEMTTEEMPPPDYPSFVLSRCQYIGKREMQEDSLCHSDWRNQEELCKRGLLAAVADGIGGIKNGAMASSIVVNMIYTRFMQQLRFVPGNTRLLDLMAQAHLALLEANRQESARTGTTGLQSGTTLVSVLIQDWDMWLLSVGDSRIYLYRGGGLMMLNREHTYARFMDEDDALNDAPQQSSANDPRAGALTAYIGQEDLRLIDRTIFPIRLLRGDRIALMSDGVFKVLSDSQITDVLAKHEAATAADELIRQVQQFDRPGQDNATAIVIEIV